MATKKSMSDVQSMSITSNFPWLGSAEGLRPFLAPMKCYAALCNEALGFTARCLQGQAEYVRKLAACTAPAEALKCHGEFAQQSWTRCASEGSKLVDTLRTSMSFSSSDNQLDSSAEPAS